MGSEMCIRDRMWVIQTVRGGSGSNCSAGIYTGVGAATWITIGIVVYIALVIFGMPGACPASL